MPALQAISCFYFELSLDHIGVFFSCDWLSSVILIYLVSALRLSIENCACSGALIKLAQTCLFFNFGM